MNNLTSFLSMDCPWDEALDWLGQSLARAGLRVLRTFDLQNVRFNLEDCPCPNHGTEGCDCQMVVVLVYGQAAEPATLILHGNDGQTWFSLVNTPLQHPDPSLQSSIEQAIRLGLPG